VANAALARILSYLFADRPAALARIAALEAESASILAEAVSRRVSRRSAARGRAVADAIAGWAVADGFAELNLRGPHDPRSDPVPKVTQMPDDVTPAPDPDKHSAVTAAVVGDREPDPALTQPVLRWPASHARIRDPR
jgi:hypothetical protein